MDTTVKNINKTAEPLANSLGYELVKTEYVKEGNKWFLRFFIDQANGISLDDCVNFSEKVSEALDALDPDPIPQAYYLEVSSIGAERPLEDNEDYKQAVGKYVQVTLAEAVEGQSVYEGDLIAVTEDNLELNVRIKSKEKLIKLPKDKIARAQLTVKL